MRLIGLIALAAGVLAAQTVKTGPDVGSAVPGFSLPDQSGQVHSLQSLMGPKGLLLVFYRSADW
jgi:hypothetical protein